MAGGPRGQGAPASPAPPLTANLRCRAPLARTPPRRYYEGEEDGFDMRKPLARDVGGERAAPLDRPVTAKQLAESR